MKEPLRKLFTSSKLLILDFNQIPDNIRHKENIKLYFEESLANHINPRLAKNRQKFNDQLTNYAGVEYLVCRYGEDRSSMIAGSTIANEGRTIHLGVDIFTKNLANVYAPCDGEIVQVGQEPENHSFGHYLILRPDDTSLPYIFFGHLAASGTKTGNVQAGEKIAEVGDYINHENGGWSRHLHIQMLTQLPKGGLAPIGYSTKESFENNKMLYPDPMLYFPEWKVKGLNS